MAVTTEASPQATTMKTPQGADKLSPDESGGRLRTQYFKFTQSAAAGDATSTQDLTYLPAGKLRVLGPSSRVTVSAFGASRTLDVGFGAYTKTDGTAVVAAGTALLAAGDVSAAATLTLTAFPLVDSKGPVLVQAKVAGGTIPAGATIEGYVTYSAP